MLSHKIDTVVVGGGQAGLAISYHLSPKSDVNMLCWNERLP
jgi:cation diffusion facilitator CzcD-associated flavoprotein CzcO